MDSRRVLLLLRHAKSDWDSAAKDHDRPLNARGRRAAVAVGQLLATQGISPDLVVCSTAVRTRQTWDGAVAGGAQGGEVRYCDEVYQASPPGLLSVVRAVSDEAATLLLIGHAPGVPGLVRLLAAPDAHSPAWTRLERGYPTAALAVLTLSGPWADAREDAAELTSFEVPRG